MNYGVKNCIWTSLGDISANFIQGTLVIFVIGSFFSDNSTYLNVFKWIGRSEEHTSELQSRRNLVCRLLLEKKKKT